MGLLQGQVGLLSNILPSFSQVPIVIGALIVSVGLYRLYFHPLSHIPGPPFACVSSLFLYAICYYGTEGHILLYYHQKYNTPVLRIAPNAVSISDGDALHSVYVAGGGLPKDARYSNFRVEGHDTIFSTLDTAYRDARAKAVLPLFAPSRIRSSCEDNEIIGQLVDKFVTRLEMDKASASKPQNTASPAKKVDILDLSSRLSLDVLTGYLFNKIYGGLDEREDINPTTTSTMKPPSVWANKLSATPFVLAIVAFSRFSLLPNWLFNLIFSALAERVLSKEDVLASLKKVDGFTSGILESNANIRSKADTYQSRLLAAGISRAETLIQCKAAMFAGADSTAVILATILFHLVRSPDVRKQLQEEIAKSPAGSDPQGLPYLRAVIREGLRLGMANPARLTRIVPRDSKGLTVSGFYLPPGTKVGAAAYVFHHNPQTYPAPFEFQPQRWLPQGIDRTDGDMQARRIQERDMFAFGLGARACVGRNLATQQLFVTVKAIVERGVLEGARTCKDKIEIIEWFNAEIMGHTLEIEW
ncbi:hypothetical protein P175DRAFT_0524665 [Aspergillus ochraceoroseus IBT 24754]|uniref:Cytochrome P450 n=2 Tax=Aspergillus ochraceoroseus TaxID=138278 RepID=A0A2T5LVZ1_9EURO|nr:uncharacterized protein P175DRAFT_0524665 [Aspergillus ochraceoroseus IBT 24754]KKK24830.1 hypothetical protein AOCH_000269 [Aspergillus ochraceoroseus]PTU20448.1 hypothetical protein P175DRAFT_0524665 [Aspergillus ochraceoroseus IBT 24754]